MKDKINNSPKAFELEQNFPHPFNPGTKISYNRVKVQNLDMVMVSMRVDDILGREVVVLVNEEKLIGTYTTTWKAPSYASEVCFYRIKAGAFHQTKMMISQR